MDPDSSSTRFTITFAHFRYGCDCSRLKVYHRGQHMWEPEAKGGLTICSIRDEETGFTYLGAAICSKEDDFCYRVGRTISQSRAADQMGPEVKSEFDPRKAEGVTTTDTGAVYTDLGVTRVELETYDGQFRGYDPTSEADIPAAITPHEPPGA